MRTPNEKFLLLFEATKRSLLACELIHSRLESELEELESDMNKGVEISERAAAPLLSAAAFIDFAHRFGALVDSLPLINKRKPQMKQLKSVLTPVEAARNHLQHLRGDLSSNDSVDYAVLGSLSWTKNDRCFLISFSQPTDMRQFSISYDAMNRRWTAIQQYRVKDVSVSLDIILAEMRSFYDWLTKIAVFSEPEVADLKWGKTIAVAFKLEIRPRDQNQQSNTNPVPTDPKVEL
jgi:hypothetical protein